MEISSLFRPLEEDFAQYIRSLDTYSIGKMTRFNFGDLPGIGHADIVIIGCDEDRGSHEIQGSALAPAVIRKHLYKLTAPRQNLNIVDLGNLKKTDRMVQYYDVLAQVTREVVKRDKILIIIGGSQDITYGQYMGYEGVNHNVEYVSIDSQLDVQDSDFGINNHTYNHKIFIHSPNYLFNFTNLGYQGHFTSLSERKRIKNLHFAGVRLGELRADIREAEPYLRNANLVSFDISCIRSGDCPGASHPTPAGFDTEEACQLARYAGMAHRVSSISFCEVHPMKDFNEQASILAAMLVWYFIEGVYNRKEDEPIDLSALTKYTTHLQGGAHEIVFFKNESTGRWWMEVPYTDALKDPNGRRKLMPCSPSDYEKARMDEIPEKWWLAHYKLK